jgi:hypothetical protein
VLTRLIPLFVGVRAPDFSWDNVASALGANVRLVWSLALVVLVHRGFFTKSRAARWGVGGALAVSLVVAFARTGLGLPPFSVVAVDAAATGAVAAWAYAAWKGGNARQQQ